MTVFSYGRIKRLSKKMLLKETYGYWWNLLECSVWIPRYHGAPIEFPRKSLLKDAYGVKWDGKSFSIPEGYGSYLEGRGEDWYPRIGLRECE